MGGEITWRCGGNGGYIFELIFYRDCNGAEVNTISENLRVWNHPTLTNITVAYVSRTDISPSCTSVSSGPAPLDCGSGSGGGNGVGAIEKVLYKSNEIQISGTPPNQGWIFTYENYARSNVITNLSSPSNYGMTIAATMYQVSSTTGCFDSSPQFLQAPYFVSCVGDAFTYNMNAIDPDLDSVFVQFSSPMNNFPAGTYNPPNNPAPVPFDPGFTFTSPTPNAAMSAGSIPAQINPQNGEITFTSTLQGNYVVKVEVSSFRNQQLIAKVEREMQLVIVPCMANNAPIFTAPFSGSSFTTSVNAGDLVNFNLLANDNGFLQDGSPQQVTITASGPMFGANFTSNLGCDIEPCAFTDGLPATGTNTADVQFTWQTQCDHVINSFGVAADVVPYFFVFKAQDNYCQVPKVTYATIQINVINQGIIPATQLGCIGYSNGNYTLNWTAVSNPQNSFVSYDIYSVQNGLIASISSISTTQYLIPEAQGNQDFYVGVVSGCNGSIVKFSDTLHPIVLQLVNPSNGTANLQWNDPFPGNTINNGYFHIYQDFPLATLTFLDSVPFSTLQYKDTIRLCDAQIGYQIQYYYNGCTFLSNIPNEHFEDMLTPAIPIIQSVGFDPNNNNALVLNWNQNSQPDTYGYVIYTFDSNNFLIEIDTVWGWASTSYTYNPPFSSGPLTYSVAAFDSCFTNATPITYQTSAKAALNRTVFLTGNVNGCQQQIDLQWTAYLGHTVTSTQIYSWANNQMTLVGSSTGLMASVDVAGGNSYIFYVQAQLNNGETSFSNPFSFTVPLPGQPLFNYLSSASVNGSNVEIKVYVDQASGVNEVQIEKKMVNGTFSSIGTAPVIGNFAFFIDNQVEVNSSSYTYRAKYIDTCGNIGFASNEATTILTDGFANEELQTNFITWSPYLGFDGGVDHYEIFRKDPSGSSILVASVPSAQLSIEDSIDSGPYPGEICYFVEAIESLNSYNFQEVSRSNELCLVYQPIIYIPNAFYPDGINNLFKPVAINIDPNSFRMTILNRWSNIIFSTTDYNQGWDGRFGPKNELVPNDMYIYIIEFHDAAGKETIKRGNVTVVR